MVYQYQESDGGLTIRVPLGHIDTNTSADFEASVRETVGDKNPSALTLDLTDVAYISSAGLRVILKYLRSYPDLALTNVSSDVFDILQMTGFTDMMRVEKAFRQFSVEGCKVLGAGAKGIVYRVGDDTIIKVYRKPDSLPMIKRERELARKAFVKGVPTAISYDVVKVGESYGSVFELLDCNSISQELSVHPERTDEYAKIFADLLRVIHNTEVLPGEIPDIKDKVFGWLDVDADLLTGKQVMKLRELIEKVPSPNRMLHCDYHTNNVMMQGDEAICIDMDTLSQGSPIFELANIWVAYIGFGVVNRSMVEKFMGLSYEACGAFWNAFLKHYLDGKNESEIGEIEQKIRLVGCMRLLSHYYRRLKQEDEECKAYIRYALDEISALLEKVETLDI